MKHLPAVPRRQRVAIDHLPEDLVRLVPHRPVDRVELPGGHYFTIWASRQTGKTWLMRRAIAELRARHGDRFVVAAMSMQSVSLKSSDPPEAFLEQVPGLVRDSLRLSVPAPTGWRGFGDLFKKGQGPLQRPLILLIDEFDRLPAPVIDELVSQFRDLYLDPEGSLLHGLALIGVRALLGVDSPRGSPFNVQRALHVPNLTRDEVSSMFAEYQAESGQRIDPEVVETLHRLLRGQPGLIGWFGELLTEKYNPAPTPITMDAWHRVYAAACQVEPNNTMLNLLKKATGPYLPQVLEIFNRTDVPFSFGQEWCNYLYLNGVIDYTETVGENGLPLHVCRFSSPFVQQRLFNDLSTSMLQRGRVLPLDPLDTLADVFTETGIDVPALLGRYVAYLGRLKARGEDPWRAQPRRADLHHTEAVGHFHLYNWLTLAVPVGCLISPEFPTGNGTVDLVLRFQGHDGIIEVKSFVNQSLLHKGQEQAAGYARKLGLSAATLALFVPITEEDVLRKLSTQRVLSGVTVTTVAISWDA